MTKVGMVYIVGAGPGDPELITVRGLRCLRQADVVAYDRLIHPSLLNEAPLHAERIHVGKTPGQPSCSQEQINHILVMKAGQGKSVVRLKGGDPFVFGRGSEECIALAQAGIPFQVVPGVTSAVAVPAYAGVPVTHRNLARSFTVVTGHTAGFDPVDLDWETLARLDTLVFLMGVGNLPRIAQRLIDHGRSPETPIAVVQCGTTDSQQAVYGTLANVHKKAAHIQPPATIVIGDVVNLSDQINWFHPLLPNYQRPPTETVRRLYSDHFIAPAEEEVALA